MLNTHHRWLIAETYKQNAYSAFIKDFHANEFVVGVAASNEFYPDAKPEHFWLDEDESGVHLNALISDRLRWRL